MIMAWAGFSRGRSTDVFGVAQLANADDFGLIAGESTSVPKSSTFTRPCSKEAQGRRAPLPRPPTCRLGRIVQEGVVVRFRSRDRMAPDRGRRRERRIEVVFRELAQRHTLTHTRRSRLPPQNSWQNGASQVKGLDAIGTQRLASGIG